MPLYRDSDGILSQFRGLAHEREFGEAKTPANFVDKILSDCKIGQISPIQAAIENWSEIVGAKFGGLCEPCDAGATVLYVRTFNAAAKQELMFEERKILAKIRAIGACSKIRKIKFL